MRRTLFIVGAIVSSMGAAICLLAAYGSRHGDGFGAIGAAQLGVSIFFVGLISLAAGLLAGKFQDNSPPDQ